VNYLGSSLRDLELLPGGVINVQGQALPCTQNFLEELASSIKMPAAYAYDIDFDLFQLNFHQRKRVKDQAVQVCVVAGRKSRN
jgi:hypothetical protein